MVIQLMVNVEAPDVRPCLNGELHHDLKTLVVDCLALMHRNSEFPIKSEVIELPTGTLSAAASEMIVQLLANKPLLTKADLTRRFGFTMRTLERHVADGKIPRPIKVRGPRWRAEDIAAYETEKNGPPYPHRD